MDEIKEREEIALIRRTYESYRGESMPANAVLQLCDKVEHLLSRIRSLESQLNIEWDDERVKEIESALRLSRKNFNENIDNFEPDSEEWNVLQDINKILSFAESLLSLLKKERVEKKELEKSLTIKILENAKGAQVLSDAEAKIKELEAEVKRLQGEKEYWANTCKEAQEFRDRNAILLDIDEASLKRLEDVFPCGHRKIDWDDSYGNCVACTMKEYADKYDDQLGLEEEVKRLQFEKDGLEASIPKDPTHPDCIIVLKSGFDAFIYLARQKKEQAEAEVKQLREGIEKHRKANWKTIEVSDKANEELYKLVEKEDSKGKCNRNHDNEFEVGQRHCRECGKYLFEE